MKDFKFVYILIILSIFYSFNAQSSGIIFIIDATLNGTGSIANLGSIEGDCIYFSYDFGYHANNVQEKKDIAYFEVDTENNLLNNNSINYGFVEKNWTDIQNSSEIENIDWVPMNSTNKYYKFVRTNEKMNTLLLRINKNGRKEGFIYISNLLDIDEEEEVFEIFHTDKLEMSGYMLNIKLISLFLFLLYLS